jgi:hypothetical protein
MYQQSRVEIRAPKTSPVARLLIAQKGNRLAKRVAVKRWSSRLAFTLSSASSVPIYSTPSTRPRALVESSGDRLGNSDSSPPEQPCLFICRCSCLSRSRFTRTAMFGRCLRSRSYLQMDGKVLYSGLKSASLLLRVLSFRS